MSLRKHVRWNDAGDPILTIKAEGHSDVYRLACHLERGQCEFVDLGRRILRSLQNKWGKAKLQRLEDFYWGEAGRNGRLLAAERRKMAELNPLHAAIRDVIKRELLDYNVYGSVDIPDVHAVASELAIQTLRVVEHDERRRNQAAS